MTLVVGIDIGGTKTAAAVVDCDDGSVHEFLVKPTPASDGGKAVLLTAIQTAKSAIDTAGQHVVACGIGTAGTITRQGVVSFATSSIDDWCGTDIATVVSIELGLPVRVLNDVQAAALGESRYGAAAGFDNTLTVAIGTGVGGGFTQASTLAVGENGVAGSIGHLRVHATAPRRCACGGWGHLEAHVAGPALEAQYATTTGEPSSLAEIAARARAGEQAAELVFNQAGSLLGEALAQAAVLLDPGVIVISGGVAATYDLLAGPLQEAFYAQVFAGLNRIPIRVSELRARATILGAAAAASRP